MNNALHNRDCPPLMSDQRHVTDYRPSCQVHDLIARQNNIKNSEHLRIFLQRNADQLRNLNQQYFMERAGCNTCRYYHVDPNNHVQQWNAYKKWLSSRQ